MSREEARDILRRAFVSTGEVPPELAALLAALLIVPEPDPRRPARR